MDKLKTYLKNNGLKVTWFAEQLGLSQTQLSKILHGHTKPSRTLKKLIASETKGEVVEGDWG